MSFTEMVTAAAMVLGVAPWQLAAGPPYLVETQLQIAVARSEASAEADNDRERQRMLEAAVAAGGHA